MGVAFRPAGVAKRPRFDIVGHGDTMLASNRPNDRQLHAPESLGLDTRASFRQAAVSALEEMPEGESRLVIDLSGTRHVDSAGLGALMLVQRRAGERRQRVALRSASEELRFLLMLTKLEDLFELEPEQA
jgi:anti-anti-sigma factor